MKKYGDDADSFHDQGTRVEESKKWHERNQLRHDYSYRSSSKSKPSYNTKRSTYKPDYSKTYYKPNYSKKTNTHHRKRPSRTTSYNNQRYKKRQSHNIISVEEANKRIKHQNKKSKNKPYSNEDNLLMALFCICGVLAVFIAIAIENIIAFPIILIGLMSIICIIWWTIEALYKKLISFKESNIENKFSNKNKAIFGILAIIGIIIISSMDLVSYRNMILVPFLLPAIFLIIPSKKVNSSKFLAIISFIVFITLLLFILYLEISFVHYSEIEFPMRFILYLLISCISLFCILLLLTPNSKNNKKGYLYSFKQALIYPENNTNNQNISKSKLISWISYLVGGYLYINGIDLDYYYIRDLNLIVYIGDLNLIVVFIVAGAICASIVFILLTFLEID